jgi:hypothetical protein
LIMDINSKRKYVSRKMGQSLSSNNIKNLEFIFPVLFLHFELYEK